MAIRILCRRPGFRRAGVAHAADRTWPDGSFTEAQLDQLRTEPLLTVIEVPEEASNGGPDGDASGAGLSGGAAVSSQAHQNTEGGAEAGIAPGAPQGTAGSQLGASQEGGSSSSSGASDEAGKGAADGATSSAAPTTNTKPKGGKPSGEKATGKAAEK